MPTTTVYYDIIYQNAEIMDPNDPTKALLFNSESDANTYISENELTPEDCIILPVTITE